MKKIIFIIAFCSLNILNAQFISTQYFDGADTNTWNSILVQLDTTISGVWQIGVPQKTIFESASTTPNVLITDTVNTYPNSLSSSAWFNVPDNSIYSGFLAVQWIQKIDFELNKDGGLVEFSSDSGVIWQNAFYNPNVYNFYGWHNSNEGYLYDSGDPCFSGTDTVWRNVWLCFTYHYLWTIDNLFIRFRIVSDSTDTNQEGWMIDNLMIAQTWFHTVVEQSKESNFKIYPTVSEGLITLQQLNNSTDFRIKNVTISNMNGQIIKTIPVSLDVETLDLSDLSQGRYLLVIESTENKETHEIMIIR